MFPCPDFVRKLLEYFGRFFSPIAHTHDEFSLPHDHDGDYADVSHGHAEYATDQELTDGLNTKADTGHTHTAAAIAIVGEVRMFASMEPATGNWILCDGTAYSTTALPELFAAIGYIYGQSGSNFKVPNMDTRFPRGTAYPDALGELGGAATHTLTVGEMPGHSHPFNILQIAQAGTNRFTAVNNISTKINTDSAGGGLPHNNLPPFLKLGFWIFAG